MYDPEHRESTYNQIGFTESLFCAREDDKRETKHLQALEQGTDERSRLRLFPIDLLEYDSIVAAVNGTPGVLDPEVLRPFLSSTYMYIVFSHFGLVEQFWGSLGGNLGSGSMLNSHTLVLDGEKGELVKAPGGVEKKDGVLEVKDVAALKSHSVVLCHMLESCYWPADVVKSEDCSTDVEYCKQNKLWYPASKTLAENAAWEFAKEKGLDVVVVNPGTVMGHVLPPTINASMLMILRLLQGCGAAKANFGSLQY